jgi:hypothetical protein
MTCHRCDGLMNHERFYDLGDYSGDFECEGWRCINCGAIVDPVIAARGQVSSLQRPSQSKLITV